MIAEVLKFLKEDYFVILYIIALVLSINTYKKYFDTPLKYFPFLIAYTFFNDVLGYFIRYSTNFAFVDGKDFANDVIYNIYDIVYYSFFFVLFWRLVEHRQRKNAVKVLALLALAVYIISCFFQNPFMISLYYATSFASLVLVAVIGIYFIDKKHIWKWEQEKYNLMLWVCAGLLIFHTVFPFLFLSGYLQPKIWYDYNFQSIIRILIVVMYCLFSIGFIVSRRRAFR